MTKAPGKVPHRQKRRIYLTAFAGGGNDFATIVENLCEGRPLVPEGIDFYSARFSNIARKRDGNSVEVAPFEELRPAFEAFLARHDIDAPDAFLESLRAHPVRTQPRGAHTATTTTIACANWSLSGAAG